MELVPRIGVSVSIRKGNKVLLGHRLSQHGHGTWAVPGGHLDFGETLQECAKREVMEETGLAVFDIAKGIITEDFYKETNKHYITFHMVCDWHSGEPEVKEPDKCAEWKWFTRDELPERILLSYQNALEAGFNPFKI